MTSRGENRDLERTLAVDYGEKRLGLAVSDPSGLLAQPLCVLPREAAIAKLAEIIAVYDVGEIVVGLPLSLSGKESAKTKEVLAFVDELKASFPELTIVTFDERLTTKQAERALVAADLSRRNRRRVIDKIAASLILEAYLVQKGNSE